MCFNFPGVITTLHYMSNTGSDTELVLYVYKSVKCKIKDLGWM